MQSTAAFLCINTVAFFNSSKQASLFS
jgi:hypothetical protein